MTAAVDGVTDLAVYRDDGPLAVSLARLLRSLPGSSAVLQLAAVAALLAALLADRGAVGAGMLAGVASFVVLSSAAAAAQPSPRLQWLVPPLLRAGEYGLHLELARRAGGTALPVVYALLAAVAFRHYDVVYRLRQDLSVARAAGRLGGGWEGRSIVLAAAAAGGAVVPVGAVLAGWCAAVFCGETALGWIGRSREQRQGTPTKGEV